ncbi:hypothetical protein ACJJTC_005807 [Scirpophaga incertulas]
MFGIPGAAVALLGGSLDWQYDTLPNNKSCLSYRNQQCRFSRGRCLGGSTSIQSDDLHPGHTKRFDELGIPGWTWGGYEAIFLTLRRPKSSRPITSYFYPLPQHDRDYEYGILH